MEKRKPTYDLEAFKAAAPFRDKVEFKGSALRTAFALGYTVQDMIRIIQTMTKTHFYKSMTAYQDHMLWQDVYHVPSDEGILYIKFAAGQIFEFDVLSFKEK